MFSVFLYLIQVDSLTDDFIDINQRFEMFKKDASFNDIFNELLSSKKISARFELSFFFTSE